MIVEVVSIPPELFFKICKAITTVIKDEGHEPCVINNGRTATIYVDVDPIGGGLADSV
jgi:hypothetical protein